MAERVNKNVDWLVDDTGQVTGYQRFPGDKQALVSTGDGIGVAGAARTFGAAGTTATAGFSILSQIPASAIPYAVQPIYFNWSAATYAVTAARVAASPTNLSDGTGLTNVPVTFVDTGTNIVPVAVTGAANDIVPGMLAGDVIPLAGVARTDTPANAPLVLHRIYSADAQSAISGADITVYNAASGGRQWAHRVLAGDQVSAWPVTTINESTNAWIQPAIMRFYYSVPTFTVAACGDSLFRGQGSTANALGWLQRLGALLTTSARVFEPMVMAWSGQTHTASCKIAKQTIRNIKPARVIIAAWSPNDGAATQAAMDRCWAETLDVIEYGRQQGVVVDVATSGPVNSFSGAEDARVKAQNVRVRALSIAGVVLDHASVLEDPANRTQILAAYNSGDGLHYNDAGYAALAAYAATVYRPRLGF